MTVTVVVATEKVQGGHEPRPAAELLYWSESAMPAGPAARESGPPTLVRRLLDQLASLNVQHSHVITRPELAPALRKGGYDVIESADAAADLREIARLARAAAEPLLLVHGDLVAGDELLTRLTGAGKTAAIVRMTPEPAEGEDAPVRARGGRVESAGSGFHQVSGPNAVFAGALLVDRPDLRTLATAAEALAAQAGDERDAPALALVGLVRSGVRVAAQPTGPLVGVRARSALQAEEVRAAVEAVDEDKVRLAAAVKTNDGFFTTFAVSTYSPYLARWSARRQLTPNIVTSISMGVAVLAAVWFAAGTRTGMVVGAVLLYFAFVFDCVDGQLARYTRQFSTFGAWLDATFDRAKEYVVYAGLAAGSTAAAAGSPVRSGDVWALAVAALGLQTFRHMVDFSYGAGRKVRGPVPLPVLPLDEPGDGVPPRPATGAPARADSLLAGLTHRTESVAALHWAKKMIVLPIGERFALISITAAFFNARVTFVALLCWGAVATCYTLSGRLLRSYAR